MLKVSKDFNFIKLLFCIIIFMLEFVTNGEAIKCFVCDSSDNPSCADLKSNSSIVAEECTLDKMKSIETWLFELNKFAYFDTGANKSPLMMCQKVVARDPNTNQMVTARFCQLNTGDSDACAILRAKLRLSVEDAYNNNNRRMTQQQQSQTDGGQTKMEDEFHCSICTSDNCNGARSNQVAVSTVLLSLLAIPFLRHC